MTGSVRCRSAGRNRTIGGENRKTTFANLRDRMSDEQGAYVMSDGSHSFAINARIQEMKLPPMRDALVLGKNAPIGCVAMRKALELVSPSPYAHIEFDDDVISDVLIRRSIMARLSDADLIAFVLRHVKPHMNADEVLDLELHVEIQVEAKST